MKGDPNRKSTRHSEGKRRPRPVDRWSSWCASIFSSLSGEFHLGQKLINDAAGCTMPPVLSHVTPDRLPETPPQSRISLKVHTDITQRQREAKRAAGSGHMIGKTSRMVTFNVSVLQNNEHNVRRYLCITVVNMCIYDSVSVLKCSDLSPSCLISIRVILFSNLVLVSGLIWWDSPPMNLISTCDIQCFWFDLIELD